MLFNFPLALALVGAIADGAIAMDRCKCSPTDTCWPSISEWSSLNSSISGRLIKTVPAAIVCYDGPQKNLDSCKKVLAGSVDSEFIADDPIALCAVINETCPAVDYVNGAIPQTCEIGSSPVYAVDANCSDDIAKGVNFARKNNIRLVIRNTGHDSSGRSTGYGSLEIWIHHLKQGISFQSTFLPSDNCTKSGWKESAMKISGGYIWREVYAEANRQNVIIAGAGDATVGCLGGWVQGGGHSPASRDYGLGADQILEAQVVLASGELVTASSCQNTELYTAIRGGGGGTYGVVVSTTVKTYPSIPVVTLNLTMTPLSDANIPEFLDALAIIYSEYPSLDDGGYSGYGIYNIGPSSTVYAHNFAIFNSSLATAQAVFSKTAAKLASYNNTSLFISTTYTAFPTYQAFFNGSVAASVGGSGALGSRLLDKVALSKPLSEIKAMLNITAGLPGELPVINSICVVSGGKVFSDAAEPYSGVNPAWRKSYVHHIVARIWAPDTVESDQQAVRNDITFVKVGAMKKLAPDTGSYMNEGDRSDQDYLKDFYGDALRKLQKAKKRYDPHGLFYCPTCVGSDEWREEKGGRLCRV